MLPWVHAEARVFWSPRTYWPLAEPSDARTSSLVNIVIRGRAFSRALWQYAGAAPFGFARGAYSTQKQNRFAICESYRYLHFYQAGHRLRFWIRPARAGPRPPFDADCVLCSHTTRILRLLTPYGTPCVCSMICEVTPVVNASRLSCPSMLDVSLSRSFVNCLLHAHMPHPGSPARTNRILPSAVEVSRGRAHSLNARGFPCYTASIAMPTVSSSSSTSN